MCAPPLRAVRRDVISRWQLKLNICHFSFTTTLLFSGLSLPAPPFLLNSLRFASKKAGGSSKNLGGKSAGRRYGFKKQDGNNKFKSSGYFLSMVDMSLRVLLSKTGNGHTISAVTDMTVGLLVILKYM